MSMLSEIFDIHDVSAVGSIKIFGWFPLYWHFFLCTVRNNGQYRILDLSNIVFANTGKKVPEWQPTGSEMEENQLPKQT
jgi:hypothetical protein